MRWGVRDEAMDDHATTDLCLQEIDNCQRLSVGPNFCVSHLSRSYMRAFIGQADRGLHTCIIS